MSCRHHVETPSAAAPQRPPMDGSGWLHRPARLPRASNDNPRPPRGPVRLLVGIASGALAALGSLLGRFRGRRALYRSGRGKSGSTER